MKKKIFSILFALVLNLSLVPAVPAMAAQAPVDLGSAGNFVILSKSGITTTGTTSIVGDIGVSPIAYAAITGFALTPVVPDGTNTFATSPLVTGRVYAADYTEPTPTNLGIAVLDMEAAYTDAAGRTLPDFTELGAGNIGGLTLVPGLYKWSSGVIIPTDVTLSGGNNAVWIFQIAGTLDISSATKVILSGGAQAKNIFWAVADVVALGTTSEFNGNILAKTNITMTDGATLNGRALAQTAVTLIANNITGCEQTSQAGRSRCNQGVGNGPENCDPGNSNQGNLSRSNDELGGTPGNPGR
ncbi:MAG: ice-binding family protein [Deltaproteobacteria bacterium]|nr:ice-binding family protein [Deltaproteobacteria bacterium]